MTTTATSEIEAYYLPDHGMVSIADASPEQLRAIVQDQAAANRALMEMRFSQLDALAPSVDINVRANGRASEIFQIGFHTAHVMARELERMGVAQHNELSKLADPWPERPSFRERLRMAWRALRDD